MFEDIKKELSSVKLLSFLLTIAVGLYLFQFAWQFLNLFSDIIVILVLSWVLSFIISPAVEKIQKLTNFSKTGATAIAYVIIAGIFMAGIFMFIPVIGNEFQNLSAIVPKYLASAPSFVQKWSTDLTHSLDNLLSIAPSVANFLFSLTIIFIISFYLIVDDEKINKEIIDLVPPKWRNNIKLIQNIVDETFASFLRIQLLFGLVSGVATWIVLTVLGVKFAALSALIAGILTIVPVIGPYLALIPPVFVGYIQDPARALFVLISLLLIQQVIFNIWGPKLMGKVFKVHPIIILLSFIIGSKIAGIMGAIFAIPVIGAIGLIIHDLGRRFFNPEHSHS